MTVAGVPKNVGPGAASGGLAACGRQGPMPTLHGQSWDGGATMGIGLRRVGLTIVALVIALAASGCSVMTLHFTDGGNAEGSTVVLVCANNLQPFGSQQGAVIFNGLASFAEPLSGNTTCTATATPGGPVANPPPTMALSCVPPVPTGIVCTPGPNNITITAPPMPWFSFPTVTVSVQLVPVGGGHGS